MDSRKPEIISQTLVLFCRRNDSHPVWFRNAFVACFQPLPVGAVQVVFGAMTAIAITTLAPQLSTFLDKSPSRGDRGVRTQARLTKKNVYED